METEKIKATISEQGLCTEIMGQGRDVVSCIAAVMNTFAESAGDVVFERKGAPWYFEPRIPAGKTVAALAHDCYQWRARMVSRQGAIGFELTQKE